MTMNRRSFLKGMLGGAGIIVGAPAICSAKNLMKIWVPPQTLIIPTGFGNMVWAPAVRRIFPGTISSELVGIQPLISFTSPYGSVTHREEIRQTFMAGLMAAFKPPIKQEQMT